MTKTVKCQNCGFLSLSYQRGFGANMTFASGAEVRSETRATGQFFTSMSSLSCYMRRYDLEEEYSRICEEMKTGDESEDKNYQPRILALLERERECDAFFEYYVRFEPQSHVELAYQEQTTREQREWQEKMLGRNMRFLIAVGVIVAGVTALFQFILNQ